MTKYDIFIKRNAESDDMVFYTSITCESSEIEERTKDLSLYYDDNVELSLENDYAIRYYGQDYASLGLWEQRYIDNQIDAALTH